MAEIKWIKLTVNMFDDEKIRLIQAMPEADAIIIIWIRLLTLAGKTNSNGQIYITENMPYNEEMLATLFNKPVNTIRLAIETLRNFGMIDVFNNGILIVNNWEKHQNVDGMEKIREKERIRKQKQRQRQKMLKLPMSQDSHGTVTGRHAIDIDIDIEGDIDIKNMSGETDILPYKEIIDHLNSRAKTKYRHTTEKTKKLIKARFREGFTLGDFKTVIDIKTLQWLNDPKMSTYLRPETLFGTKFESYLNEKPLNNNQFVKRQEHSQSIYKPLNIDYSRGED